MRQANRLLVTVLCFVLSSLAYGDRDKDRDEGRETSCSIPRHVVHEVQSQLAVVVQQNNGGIFNPNRGSVNRCVKDSGGFPRRVHSRRHSDPVLKSFSLVDCFHQVWRVQCSP